MKNTNNDTAISVEDLSKVYKLYDKKKDRMKEALNLFGKKYFEQFYALKNVSFNLNKGEILGIVGRNGAGKSTLLEIITGVLTKTSGNVHSKGRISALFSLGMGFNPLLTGVENIYLNGTLQGFSKAEMDEKVDDILEFAEIGQFAYQPIKTYSSGMGARLGFAVAISVDPDILIVDEALSVGDALFRRKCFSKIENFMKMGKTIIFVSHSIELMVQLCTKMILIDKGELILEGPPKLIELYYQKFLFAKREEQKKMRDEIININKERKLKKDIIKTLQNKNYIEPGEKKENKKETEVYPNTIDSYFVANFKSKSTVEYKNYSVDIYEPEMTTVSGEKVNHIVTSEKYIYGVKIRFGIDAENVSVGFRITDEKGLHISSINLEKAGKVINKVHKNDVFYLKFSFTCNLLPGIFYITDGVASEINGERVYLNRIVDIFTFKVLNHKNLKNSGLVCLKQDVEITKE